jgi:hypothetical protein
VGRRLWGLLLRKHDPPPRFVVFVGEHESDARQMSVAMAACDGLSYKRDQVFVKLAEQDDSIDRGPPNQFVYETFRLARSSVVG